ncbi:universal stress protein [Vulgatibacter incomptus]|uniref:Universal stress protein UspA n=1 Tax=Vulgatibacter incomptus TaxID=1391653 RepID=A0A0K1P972_9BACT|nr:universal stress protein [Vulgatibacter incomptus]AKU89966.1 Universal stress protein UspA [Vulgatibacter incomptus]
MFEHVVAAVDGSTSSFHASLVGAHIAAAAKGTIDLICVVEPVAHRLFTGGDREAARQQCKQNLASAQAAIGSVAPIAHRVELDGPVAESIVGYGEESSADILCLGSARRGLKLGSVSMKVVRQAERSVVVVPSGVSSGPRLARILVGFDGSDCSREAVKVAAYLAARSDGALRIESIVPPPWPLPPEGIELDSEDVEEVVGKENLADLCAARELAMKAGAEVSSATFDLGHAAHRLSERAEEWNIDLLVVGSRGHSPARRFFLGSVSSHLASRAPCPVLIVR